MQSNFQVDPMPMKVSSYFSKFHKDIICLAILERQRLDYIKHAKIRISELVSEFLEPRDQIKQHAESKMFALDQLAAAIE